MAQQKIRTADVVNSQITYAKIQDVTASRVLGRTDASSGVAQELTLGTGLTLSGTTITSPTGTVTSVAATQPSAGFTISGSPITSSGTFTFDLSDDLAAVEGISTTGIAVRSASNTWLTRSIAVTTGADSFAGLAVGSASGTAGNPTISIDTNNSTVKLSVEAATTANITLSGTQTIDGIFVGATQRVLVMNQSTGSQNGIYTVQSGAWERSLDYNTSLKAEHSLIVYVQDGTVNGNKYFRVDQKKPTLGTTALTFTEVLSSGNGIYGGSGTIPASTVATTTSGSTFTFDYSDATDAFRITDTGTPTLYLGSKNGSQNLVIGNSSILGTASTNTMTLSASTFKAGSATYYIEADTVSPRIFLKGANSELDLFSSSTSLTTPFFELKGHNTSTPGRLRLYEKSSAGSNYTQFEAADQASNITYTLPASLPASSGDVLSATTGGVMSWVTPTSGGITTLNTLTGATQTFATGTSGTDFGISSSGTTHTFNIPSASTANRGLITTGAQTLAGAKTFQSAITVGAQSVAQGQVALANFSDGNLTVLSASGSTENWTMTLPINGGSNNQVLATNGSGTTSWATNLNGIYSGSGTIPAAAVATVTSGSTFTIDYNGGADALRFNDTLKSAYLSNKDQDNFLHLEDDSVTLQAQGGYNLYMQSNYGVFGRTNVNLELSWEDAFTSLVGGDGTVNSTLLLDNASSKIYSPYLQILGHNSSTPGEIRIYERASAGTNYTAFVAQDQSANITYTLPASAPAANGYVLSSTTGGALSWSAAASGGDGIYGGSGTIASNAAATITSGSNFYIRYNGGNNALNFSDSSGSFVLADKTVNSYIAGDNTGVGIYTASGNFVVDNTGGGAALNTNLRIYNGALSLDSSITPSTITANQNNYSPTGLATAAVLRLATDASRNITGLANPSLWPDGKLITIVNIGSFNIVLTTEDTNSTAANRFALGEGNVTLKSAEAITLWYDTTTDRWRPIDHRAVTSGGSGDVSQNGNSFGAAMVIGTNDNNTLSFETNGVTRATISTGTSTGGQLTLTEVTANTNTASDILTLRTNSTGTAAANFGNGILFQAKSSTTDNQDLARIAASWTTATHASREGALSFQLGDNGGALAEVMKLDRTTATGQLSIGTTTPVIISNAGITGATGGFTIQAGAQLMNIGTSTGVVQIYNNSNSTSSIVLSSTHNTSTSTGSVQFGGGNTYTQTSGTRDLFHFWYTFSPTSGTAVHNSLSFLPTLNQTGGANGIIRSINIAPTITAVADYRALEIAANGTNVKGLYQTGSTTTNNFVGRTSFGTTSIPNASALIDMVTTSTGLGLPAMTSTQRDAISSPRQGLVVYNTTDDKISVRRSSAWADVALEGTTLNTQSGTSYTLVLADATRMITLNNASAITLTVPTNASVAFPTGTSISITQLGAGQVTVAAAGGVTIRSADSKLKLRVQYSSASLLKINTNEWLLVGDITN